MSYADLDVYYQPEAYGLEIVGSVEWSDGCYQFDMSVVWQDPETGDLFLGEDSGCSCPSPFEYQDRDDLTPITVQDLLAHFENRKGEDWRYVENDYDGERSRIDAEIAELAQKVFDRRMAKHSA